MRCTHFDQIWISHIWSILRKVCEWQSLQTMMIIINFAPNSYGANKFRLKKRREAKTFQLYSWYCRILNQICQTNTFEIRKYICVEEKWNILTHGKDDDIFIWHGLFVYHYIIYRWKPAYIAFILSSRNCDLTECYT